MESTIFELLFACVLLLSFWVSLRLDTKLKEAESRVKDLELEVEDLQNTIEWKDQVLSTVRITAQKVNHKYQALRVDYDLLQCDNREMEKELNKFRDKEKPK